MTLQQLSIHHFVYFTGLYFYVGTLVGIEAYIQDIIVQAFISAYKNDISDNQVKAYLYKTAREMALQHLKYGTDLCPAI